jgi:hypothetical protein
MSFLERRHKDDNFVLSSLCLRGARVGGGGEDDDDHRLLSLLPIRTTNAKRKDMTMMASTIVFYV